MAAAAASSFISLSGRLDACRILPSLGHARDADSYFISAVFSTTIIRRNRAKPVI